jgi:sterol desaturase/sphingolipid hydroxylase (fatty acid hydroxylase superfamily)
MMKYFSNGLLMCFFLGLILWETWRPCIKFSYHRKRDRLRHAVANLSLGLLATSISYFIFFPLYQIATQIGSLHNWGLLNTMSLGSGWTALLALLIMDLWTYWWHRANHRIKFLWRFHRMHHSDPWMDATSAQRFHPGEIIFSSILRIPIMILAGLDLWHIVLYDIVLMSVVFFHHANITVPSGSDRLLRLIIPSPVMHKIHHSRLQQETDSNYGAVLSIWDRIFGSLRLRSDWENVSFGLDGYDDLSSQNLLGLIKTPFRKHT